MRHGTAAVVGPVVDSVGDPQGSRMTECPTVALEGLLCGEENCGFGPAVRDA